MASPYPGQPKERTRWIVSHRPARRTVRPDQPGAFFTETERSENGEAVSVATIFLTNRECPWRCLMCDLWRNTLVESVQPGAIPAQIDYALERLAASPAPRHLKLYNAGSFFDPRAIPPQDHPAIARRASSLERVVVECHPALVNERVLRFRDLLAKETLERLGPGRAGPRLEVAMGLETIHPKILPRLNKGMSLERFAAAARFLVGHQIAVRAFVLVQPPFMGEAEAVEWAGRSARFAFDVGVGVVCLIPTRGGNGALEALAARGEFVPPRLATLEAALANAIGLERGRAFADLWDLEKLADCPHCLAARQARLHHMNLTQRVLPAVACHRCGGARPG